MSRPIAKGVFHGNINIRVIMNFFTLSLLLFHMSQEKNKQDNRVYMRKLLDICELYLKPFKSFL